MLSIDGKTPCLLLCQNQLVFFIKSLISTAVGSGPLRARREIFTTPRLVTARQSILGPPAEGRSGPSIDKFFNILDISLQ